VAASARGACLRIPAAIRDAAFALTFTHGAALLIGFVGNILLVADREKPFIVRLPWRRFSETFAAFDSGWYFEIARRGYSFDPDGQSSIAFFPLYPLLVRLVAAPFGGSDAHVWAAGIGVSWIAFAAALVALHGLAERMTGSADVARRTVLYLAIFPFSFYFSRVYAEGLFLLCTVLAVRSAYDSAWVRAGLFGAFAAATRPTGVLIALPLLIMAAAGRPSLRVLIGRVLALAPVPLAVAAYSAYVYTIAGDPLAWMESRDAWGYSIGHAPYQHLLTSLTWIETRGLYTWLLASEATPVDFFYTVVALLFLALVPAVMRRFGPALGLYVLVSLAIPLSGNVLVGIGRYASVLFPVFIIAATVSSPRVQTAILVVSALFHTLFLILFIGWYPVH